MTRRLIGAAVLATSAAALFTAGPAVAVSIALLAALLREHALRTGGERRLRAALAEMEGVARSAGEVRSVKIHPDSLADFRDLMFEDDDEEPTMARDLRVLH
ncbi:hypothetical protein Sa4125_29750 [Aureimonas sp. SA4125]|uniref:hypothetical protein n=1 Tax=Aureimonas sp. SA4125 TaxID=2826993 RepID=UPI001CC6D220|nr:hypothetical protein [Aureimonas sp. SA4125]BDA85433.1 hypothetical protein Sa4125_29750 [Aureimonas sp. SA4125]